MSTLLLILSVPVLSGLALAVDYYARHSATRDEQAFLRFLVRLLGVALCAAGLSVFASMVIIQSAGAQNEGASLPIAEWMSRSMVAIFGLAAMIGGVMAEACGRAKPPKSARDSARQERNANLFRLCCWSVLLSPLVGFLPPLVILGPMLATTVLTCWGARRRGEEASLLWRLATAAECGLPLVDEIEAVALDSRIRRREQLFGLAERLRDGRSLADSLEMGDRLLPRPVILSIRAAEQTDALPMVLRAAADQSMRDVADLGGPRDVLPFQAYMTNVCVVLMVIVGFLMYWIIPKYKDILFDFDLELPQATRLLIDVTDGMAGFWYLLFPMATLPIGLLLMPGVIALLGWENLNFPMLMRWFPRRDGPSVLRAAAVAVENQRPLPAVFSQLAAHHHREDMRSRLSRVADSLQEGAPAWQLLAQEHLIQKDEAQALEAAAAAGHLPWAMRSLADVIDHRQRVREAWWAEWQRPVIVFSMAAVVGFVAIGMFYPLITVLQSLV